MRDVYQLVVQKDDFGCGVSCVASRLGMDYARALSEFTHPENASTKGYWCKELQMVLANNGLKYRLRYAPKMKPDELEAVGTIVFIKKDSTFPYGHYLLKTPYGWMDPWANLPADKNVLCAGATYRKTLLGNPQYALVQEGSTKRSKENN